MNEQKKAIELVAKQFSIIAKANGYTSVSKLSTPKNTHVFKALEAVAKQCANIAVDEIIRLANRSDLFKMKTKHQLLTNASIDETYIEYWEEVKKQINAL